MVDFQRNLQFLNNVIIKCKVNLFNISNQLLPVFSGVHVTRSLILCVCFVDRSLSFFLLAIGLTVLRYTDSDYLPLISSNCSNQLPEPMLAILAPKDLKMTWLSSFLTSSVPDEGYSRNVMCSLNFIMLKGSKNVIIVGYIHTDKSHCV